MRDGRLMIFRVVRRSVGIVAAGVTRQEGFVVNLERTGVGVIVVGGRLASDLHKDGGVVLGPAVVRDDTGFKSAVIRDVTHVVITVV